VAFLGGPVVETSDHSQPGRVGGKDVVAAADDMGGERAEMRDDQLDAAVD
jgi:hypothetical protein